MKLMNVIKLELAAIALLLGVASPAKPVIHTGPYGVICTVICTAGTRPCMCCTDGGTCHPV